MSSKGAQTGKPQAEPGCWELYHPVKNTSEFLSLCSMILMCIGLTLTLIGFVIPREFGFDPMMSAREMEEMELYFNSRSFKLDICILVGVGFLAVGGIFMSALLMKGICRGEFNHLYDEFSSSGSDTPLESSASQSSMSPKNNQNYGSAWETPGNLMASNSTLSQSK